MNEKDIYKLIGESFDDKVKLDFADVRKRIDKLPECKVTPIVCDAPPAGKRRKTIYAAVAAVAACLVCIIGISVIFSQPKSESADYAADYAAESFFFAEDAENAEVCDEAVCYSPEEPADSPTYGDYTYADSYSSVMNEAAYAETEPEAASDSVSDTDLSASDTN